MKKETRARTVRVIALLLGLLAAFVLVVFLWQPPCLILEATGLYCAGCGGQRMFYALLRGDLLTAFFHNPFLFCLLPLFGGYLFWEALRYLKKQRPLYKSRRCLWLFGFILILTVLFTVLRNLPGVRWLGP